jgi:hypothetical protein
MNKYTSASRQTRQNYREGSETAGGGGGGVIDGRREKEQSEVQSVEKRKFGVAPK